jgi:hypothetical protein
VVVAGGGNGSSGPYGGIVDFYLFIFGISFIFMHFSIIFSINLKKFEFR